MPTSADGGLSYFGSLAVNFDRLFFQARGYDRERWIHVSAWNDYDLEPAAARGVRTAFIPRAGGIAPREGSVDLIFGDVISLARALADARGGPVAYEVEAEASTGEILARFVEWLEAEHLAEVRACRGVRSAELVVLDGLHARASYRFDGRASFARYLEREGFGMEAARLTDEGIVAKFLDKVPALSKNLSRYSQDGNKVMLQTVDELLDRAAAGVRKIAD